MPMRPTPAAARYCNAGEPRPPAPTTSAREARSRSWPAQSDLGNQQMTAVSTKFARVHDCSARVTFVQPFEHRRAGVLRGIGVIALRSSRKDFGSGARSYSSRTLLGLAIASRSAAHVERGPPCEPAEKLAIAQVDAGDELGKRDADHVRGTKIRNADALERLQRSRASVTGRDRDRAEDAGIERRGEDRRHSAHTMTQRIDCGVAAVAREAQSPPPWHRCSRRRHAALRRSRRAYVPENRDCRRRSRGWPRTSKKVEILFARRVSVTGDERDRRAGGAASYQSTATGFRSAAMRKKLDLRHRCAIARCRRRSTPSSKSARAA